MNDANTQNYEQPYRAADLALRKVAGFLASHRRRRFVSVRKAEAALEQAVEPLAEALRRKSC